MVAKCEMKLVRMTADQARLCAISDGAMSGALAGSANLPHRFDRVHRPAACGTMQSGPYHVYPCHMDMIGGSYSPRAAFTGELLLAACWPGHAIVLGCAHPLW